MTIMKPLRNDLLKTRKEFVLAIRQNNQKAIRQIKKKLKLFGIK